MRADCEGMVVRVVWAGCVCCEPLRYLLSCEAHTHECAKKKGNQRHIDNRRKALDETSQTITFN
jgi:hypothetical protein